MDYAISGHSSIFFLYLFGLVERFFPGNVAVFNLALIFWGALGVWAFCEILEILFADKGSKFELLIFDLVFAFHPAVLASCLNFNVDQGVLVCFLLYLRSYLKSEFLSACFFVILMIFSKETAVLLFPIPLLVSFPYDKISQIRDWIKDRAIIIFAPPFLFMTYLVVRAQLYPGDLLFRTKKLSLQLAVQMLNPFKTSIITSMYLIEAFVFNFTWVLTLSLLISVIYNYLKRSKNARIVSPPRGWQSFYAKRLALGLLMAAFLLSRYQTFTNIRYLIPLFPLLIMSASLFLIEAFSSKVFRVFVGLTVLLVTIIGLNRSADPLTKELLGTFLFGTRPIYNMTSWTGECCGMGRDQLVYNLEFLKFDQIQNQVYADLRPEKETVILLNELTSFELPDNLTSGSLNPSKFSRAFPGGTSFSPNYVYVSSFQDETRKPEVVRYLAFPNLPARKDLEALESCYTFQTRKLYEIDGYGLELFSFEGLKSGRKPNLDSSF